ncbi:MAG: IPT/TIG domain-containing protein [Acidobacteriia bacterium]|nr:IPT/TIG domain-containing protein [Terriglobia bacterium]
MAVLLCGAAAWAQTSPAIFYSDIDSGPNTGGQNSKGAFVNIYGKGFGATQGTSTVSVGGGLADNYPLWSDTKIAFQLGASAVSGSIVVTVNGSASNGVPFTVRAGNIFFVATTGSDTASGAFATPWKTIVKAKSTIAAGDIAYIMNGVSQTALDDYNASLQISSAGVAGKPKALVAYPGAVVTIGSATGPEFGLRTPQIAGGPFSFWTIAGFVIRGNNEGIDLENLSDWRVIANDISVPTGSGPTAVVEGSQSNNIKFFGNTVHDSGLGDTKLYHSVYFTTSSNHLEVAWNTIANNKTCRGIQFHSTGAPNQFDLSVHDNVIHGQICDGINFATIDPSQGPVLAYNNIVYDVGLGPDPPDGSSNYACIDSPGITNVGSPGTGTAEVFNNTFYNCGPFATSTTSSGAISIQGGSPPVRFRNNLIIGKTGEHYVAGNTSNTLISGSNNLFFGAGAAPAQFTANLNVDPQVANLPVLDFHLTATSPAKDAGVNTGITHDFDGNPRPAGAAFDIGAFELASTAPRPNPPTAVHLVVH